MQTSDLKRINRCSLQNLQELPDRSIGSSTTHKVLRISNVAASLALLFQVIHRSIPFSFLISVIRPLKKTILRPHSLLKSKYLYSSSLYRNKNNGVNSNNTHKHLVKRRNPLYFLRKKPNNHSEDFANNQEKNANTTKRLSFPHLLSNRLRIRRKRLAVNLVY